MAFRTVYTDPLSVNGVPTALVELVDRARMLESALDPLNVEVFEQFDAPGRCAFAFRLVESVIASASVPRAHRLGACPRAQLVLEPGGHSSDRRR